MTAAAMPMALASVDFFGLAITALRTSYRTGARAFSSITTGLHENEVRAADEVPRRTDAPYFIEQSWWTSLRMMLQMLLTTGLLRGLLRSITRAV